MRRGGWHQFFNARRGDAAALSVTLLFFALFFAGPLLSGRFLVAADAYYQSFPLRSAAWQMIRDGHAPLWTPHLFAGYPFLSMGQLSLAYPVTWGYLALPGRWAEQIYVLAPYLLSPIFTYAYAREVGRSRLASLLAGLAYGYGGGMISKLGVVGFHTNALLWLPLLLVPIERARTRRLVPCLLAVAAVYALTLLNGYGQGFVYVGIVALAYAAFLSATGAGAPERDEEAGAAAGPEGGGKNTLSPRPARWRPLAVTAGGMAAGAGVAAFQILESMRAVRRSIRSALTYEVFSAGSFTPAEAVKSFAAPLYHYVEVSAYVAPLAVALAVLGVARNWRRRGGGGGDARVWFWAALAAVAFLLMLGPATPLNRLAYSVPVFNLFRYPSRHAFEWSFAVAVLAAYGWDALAASRGRASQAVSWTRRNARWLAPLAVALAVALGAALWRSAARQVTHNAPPDTGQGTLMAESAYLWLKLCLTLAVASAVWLARQILAPRLRASLLAAAIFVACFFEPLAAVSCWWFPDAKPAERFAASSPATNLLRVLPPEQNRVYTRVNLYLVPGYPPPRPPLDLPNLTALAGLHNVAGYEQLVLRRFSRALGDVGPDAVNLRYDLRGAPDASIFEPRSRVLDLLNTTHVVTFAGLSTAPAAAPAHGAAQLVERDGIRYAFGELGLTLAPGGRAALAGGAAGDTLALVTSMASSVDVAEGQRVATLRIALADGGVVERHLRAGVDTAEWAHERADVRPAIRHRLAPVFDSTAGDAENSFPAHRYFARVPVGGRAEVKGVEIVNDTAGAQVALWKASVLDSASGQSAPLRPELPGLDARRWRLVSDEGGVLVLRNLRALPRAWLVAEAEAVDGEEALRRIRGEGAREFDPRRTALLEVSPEELPQLPGGEVAAESYARVESYEPNRLVVETDAPTPAVLVVGEIFYPGWEATVDGRGAEILLTDYLLRGVVLPAGRHRVEMRYRAPAARNGALVSAGTLLLLAALAAASRRPSGLAKPRGV